MRIRQRTCHPTHTTPPSNLPFAGNATLCTAAMASRCQAIHHGGMRCTQQWAMRSSGEQRWSCFVIAHHNPTPRNMFLACVWEVLTAFRDQSLGKGSDDVLPTTAFLFLLFFRGGMCAEQHNYANQTLAHKHLACANHFLDPPTTTTNPPLTRHTPKRAVAR